MTPSSTLPISRKWIACGSHRRRACSPNPNNYSSQLRDYCTNKLNQPHRTCIIVCDKQLKKVEKKYEKMKKMYSQNKNATYDVRFIAEKDFKFSTVDMSESEKE